MVASGQTRLLIRRPCRRIGGLQSCRTAAMIFLEAPSRPGFQAPGLPLDGDQDRLHWRTVHDRCRG